jgi:hypothetical protein
MFQVMRRSLSTLMKTIKADPKFIAGQPNGHTVAANRNVCVESVVELRLPPAIANQLEELVL